MATQLETELKTYEAHKSELLGRAVGRYVLIKGTDVIDVFDAEADAIREGYRKFGNVPFLVKKVVEFDVPVFFTSSLIML